MTVSSKALIENQMRGEEFAREKEGVAVQHQHTTSTRNVKPRLEEKEGGGGGREGGEDGKGAGGSAGRGEGK